METDKILKADLLDIIFEGRNKDYGAYELRKTYRNRLAGAFAGTGLFLMLISGGYLLAQKNTGPAQITQDAPDVRLIELQPDPPLPPLPPPPPPAPAPPVQTIKDFVPIIVPGEVNPEDKFPDIQELEVSKIAQVNQPGIEDDNVVAPPVADERRRIIEVHETPEDDKEKVFIRVEVESAYPGGVVAWMRFLNKNFNYPSEARENNIQGTIVVQFIVDTEGNVSDVEAVGGPDNGGLREEAVSVIKKSGKWEPAIQNGRKVKSYKKQMITFRLQSE